MATTYNTEHVPGYTIGVTDPPSYDELAVLRTASGWDVDSPERWEQVFNSALAVVTARDHTGALVGVGVISGSVRHAVLCDLDVHPDHRRQGIGTALVNIRLATAAALDCRYVYVALSSDNSFASLYTTAGINGSAFAGELNTWAPSAT